MIDKIAWIEVKEGRVLCARSIGKPVCYLPGGKREPGESDGEALIREVLEELSVRIRPGSIAHFGTFTAQADGKPDGVYVRMACYTAEYEGELKPASEIAECVWLGYEDRDRLSPVSRLVMDRLRETGRL